MALPQQRFETLNIYDAPELMFSQLLDGELSKPGVLNAIFKPDSLSPAERDTYVSRLQKKYDNPVWEALVNIATNPFVLLAAVTTPSAAAGVTSIAKGGLGLFRTAPKFSMGFRERGPALMLLNTPTQNLRSTTLPAVASQAEEIRSSFIDETLAILGDTDRKVYEKHGLNATTGLRGELYAIPRKKQLADRLDAAIGMYLEGLHTTHIKQRPIWDGKKQTFSWVEEVSEEVGLDLPKILQRDGTLEYAEGMRKAMRANAIKALSDEDQHLRLYRAMVRPVASDAVDEVQQGIDIIEMISGDFAKAVRSGNLTQKQFSDGLKSLRDVIDRNPWYLPRNNFAVYRGDGRRLAQNELHAGQDYAVLRASGRQIPRSQSASSVVYDPEDIKLMMREYGATPGLQKMLKKSEDKIQDMIAKGESGVSEKFVKLRGEVAFRKHTDSMMQASVLSAAPNEYVLAVQARRAKELQDGIKRGEVQVQGETTPSTHQNALGGPDGGVAYGTAMNTVSKQDAPLGGFSLNDIIGEEFAFAKNGDRALMKRVAVPLVLGRSPRTGDILLSVNEKLKEVAGGMSKMLEPVIGGTDLGKHFTDALKGFSEIPVSLSASPTASAMANYFYVSHLGLNLGSVLNQTFQPFLHNSAMFGVGNTLRGWKDGFEDLGNYMKWRTQYPARIPETLRNEGMRKNFRIMQASGGDDVAGILRPITDAVEGLVVGAGRGPSEVPGVFRYYGLELPMKMFEKAEILNRLTTAYSVSHAYRRNSQSIFKANPTWRSLVKNPNNPSLEDVMKLPGAKENMREAVASYQFTSDAMNTPMIFQGVLRNPLLRQLMSFPLRSFTSFAEMGKLGENTGSVAGATLLNSIRLMGTSAVIYEASKGLFNADVSRSLGFSAVTDILPFAEGGRFTEQGTLIPTPPVVEIVAQSAKGFLSGDMELFLRQLPKFAPGGIALSRAAGVFPDALDANVFQRTFADWQNRLPDGRIPLYKNDGTLLDFRNPTELMLKGLGVDMGSFGEGTRLDRYLLTIRDEVNQYRQAYIKELMANNHDKANKTAAEFQRRFKFPLTVTKAQMNNAIKAREVPRTERILERTPAEIRGQLSQYAAGQASRFNVSAEELTGKPTSKSRQGRTLPGSGEEREQRGFSGFEGFAGQF